MTCPWESSSGSPSSRPKIRAARSSLLEPNENPVAQEYQKGLFEQGLPAASFGVTDVRAEFERLKSLGVAFAVEPMEAGPVTLAVFDDTCGNLIQIMQT